MKIKFPLLPAMLIAGVTASFNATAADKLWTVSAGLNYHDANYNVPSNKYDNESWATYLGLMRKINDLTYVGGNIYYNNSDVDFKTHSGQADVDTTSVSAYFIRELGPGLYADGAIGYGRSQIDTNMASVTYNTDAKFMTTGLGLTQYIALSQTFMANVGAHYTHISSDRDKFATNLGTAVQSSDSSLNYITLGGRLTWRLNKWSPFAGIDWNRANREFITNTGDKNYFNYNVGTRYAITEETSIGLTLGSVIGKRDTDETNAGISLSHQF